MNTIWTDKTFKTFRALSDISNIIQDDHYNIQVVTEILKDNNGEDFKPCLSFKFMIYQINPRLLRLEITINNDSNMECRYDGKNITERISTSLYKMSAEDKEYYLNWIKSRLDVIYKEQKK